IEMGKTDVRDPAQVRAEHDVAYQAFDLLEAGPDRIAGMLAELSVLFAAGELVPLPVTCWDVRRAADAFRYLSQGRNIGKIVLTIPAPPRPGTVLVTGASAAVRRVVARHLAAGPAAAGLVLASRRGPGAPGTAGLAAELAAAGTSVQVTACDAGDRAGLAAVIAAVPAGERLTGVVHTAGILDDGVTGSQTPSRVGAVMRAKADAAWHLHELTAGLDLDTFVLFSSVAGIMGSAGQGGYAAANAFLDALAADRAARGLPAQSLAWGPWQEPSGMTGHLAGTDWQRMSRQGIRPLTAGTGLALLDAAATTAEPLLIPAPLDLATLRRAETVPPLLSALVRRPARPAAGPAGPAGGRLAARLAPLPTAAQQQTLRDLILAQAAIVLGLPGPDQADAGRSFRESGFDSLTAVELRNRLAPAPRPRRRRPPPPRAH